MSEQFECPKAGKMPHPKPRWPKDDRYAEAKRDISLLMSRGHRGHFKRETPAGYTGAEVFILVFVDDSTSVGGAVRPGTIAHALHFTPSALSQVLKSLESKGCIERRRATDDNRAVEITLTEEGRRVVSEAHAMRNEQWNRLFDFLGDEDVAHLMRIARRICEFQDRTEDAR